MVRGMKHRTVRVDWVDSMILDLGDWMDVSDTKGAMMQAGMTHHTVGFLVRENSVALAVASSVNRSGDRACGVVVIPKSAVLKVKDLTEEGD